MEGQSGVQRMFTCLSDCFDHCQLFGAYQYFFLVNHRFQGEVYYLIFFVLFQSFLIGFLKKI